MLTVASQGTTSNDLSKDESTGTCEHGLCYTLRNFKVGLTSPNPFSTCLKVSYLDEPLGRDTALSLHERTIASAAGGVYVTEPGATTESEYGLLRHVSQTRITGAGVFGCVHESAEPKICVAYLRDGFGVSDPGAFHVREFKGRIDTIRDDDQDISYPLSLKVIEGSTGDSVCQTRAKVSEVSLYIPVFADSAERNKMVTIRRDLTLPGYQYELSCFSPEDAYIESPRVAGEATDETPYLNDD